MNGCGTNRFGFLYFRNDYIPDMTDNSRPIINLSIKFKQLQNIEIIDVHIPSKDSLSIYDPFTRIAEASLPP